MDTCILNSNEVMAANGCSGPISGSFSMELFALIVVVSFQNPDFMNLSNMLK